ncbi:hypothetical protein P3B99_003630 [Opitutia bacterium KCR 482]|nr:hypothetical protein [Opitutae bacterium KCR 482]
MKKLLLALSAAAAAFASDSLCAKDLFVTTNTSPENAAILDGSDVILKTNRLDSEMTSWADYYLKSSTDTLGTFLYSSGGKGYHATYHILLEKDTSFSVLENFQYNAYGSGVSSAGYSLESAAGSAITVKATNEKGFNVNLASNDADYVHGNVALGKTGRTFTIGKNVTLETKSANVIGKLRTSEASYTDSMFYVDGTLNLTGTKVDSLVLNNTNMTVRSGGEIQNKGKLRVLNGSSFTIDNGATVYITPDDSFTTAVLGGASTMTVNGSYSNMSGTQVYTGAKLIVGETGVMTGMAAVYGGSFELNGTLNGNIATSGGSISFGENVDFSKRALELRSSRDGDIKFVSDGLVGTMRTQAKSGVSRLAVADGKTLTANYITVNAETELNISGHVVYASSGSDYDKYANAVANEWVLGSLTIGNGGVLDINNTLAEANTYGKLTSLANISIAGGTLNLTGKTDSLTGIVKMGTLSISDGGTLAMKTDRTSLLIANGGTISVDATSRIAGNNILFSPAVGTSTVGYDSAKELLLGGGSSYTGRLAVIRTSNNFLTLSEGQSYNFTILAFKGYAGGNPGEAIDLTINLGGASLLHIGLLRPDDGGAADTLANLILTDFANDIVKIDDIQMDSGCDISGGVITKGKSTITIIAYDKSGELLSGGVWQHQNGYLNYVIPEPAEWAAIFGAIALAMAVYRRRK